MNAKVKNYALDKLTQDYLLTATLTLFLVVLLSLLSSHWLTKRLRKVEQAAAQVIASGSFSHRFQIQGNDEIESLGKTFNIMMERLEQAHAEMARKAQNELRLSNMRYQKVVEQQSELICRCLPDVSLPL